MKRVGKQLEEARLARHLTPEQVSRETKIRTERLLELESDNYANFSSPTYARGFVRTYARFLGLDEYRLIRQLDNRIPTDEDAPLANDSAVSYLPEAIETGAPAQVNRIGSFILSALATFVGLVILYVLVENYRTGTFSTPAPTVDDLMTNAAPAAPETAERAQPVDPNQVVAPVHPLKAEPVDAPLVAPAPKALPVDAANPPVVTPASDDAKPAPRALPVDLNSVPPPPVSATNSVPVTAAPAPVFSAPVAEPVTPPAPEVVAAPASPAVPAAPVAEPAPVAASLSAPEHLHLRAAQDTHLRVACTDDPDHQQVLYDDTLGAGQIIGLPGRRFVIDVDIPSAVQVIIDGMNRGPHSHGSQPETFTVETNEP